MPAIGLINPLFWACFPLEIGILPFLIDLFFIFAFSPSEYGGIHLALWDEQCPGGRLEWHPFDLSALHGRPILQFRGVGQQRWRIKIKT
jgi:hypothetical protein